MTSGPETSLSYRRLPRRHPVRSQQRRRGRSRHQCGGHLDYLSDRRRCRLQYPVSEDRGLAVAEREVHIHVDNLTMAYGAFVVMRDLNFEINAFCYDEGLARQLKGQFELDKAVSEIMTLERWEKRRRTKRIVESLARMFAPLL